MAKGKGDEPSGLEEFQAALHRPPAIGMRKIPSRSDGPEVYPPRFRLFPPRPVKVRPLWVNLLILTGFVAPFLGLLILVGYRRPDFWFFLFIFGLFYLGLVASVLSVWRRQPQMKNEAYDAEPDTEEEDESL